ncbi:transposase IS4 family protein [Cupriavidus basilensis OR16]|uniref:Transposase IS4 family protein n=1 Tax=Cupriavidus basilensis OR16 TaxID=1127483 RepID=H1SAX0_9BURK|nr:transposase IS4 family protein [Cupriavidus basilensis OR16]
MAALPEAQQKALHPWIESASRLRDQRPRDKNKLYALHAPEVE